VAEPDDNDKQAAKPLPANDRTGSSSRPDLTSVAMSAQGGQIPLEYKTTFHLGPSAGDFLVWVRCPNPSSDPPEVVIPDFWEFREGDRLLITNREEDYPASVEQMEEGGPSLWKVLPGDRLAWVGWRGKANERQATLVALVNCQHEGYIRRTCVSYPGVRDVLWRTDVGSHPRNPKPLDDRIQCRDSDGIAADMEASRIGV
jgi:hypothetical protein